MALDRAFEDVRARVEQVGNGPAGHGDGREAHEAAGTAGRERYAELAVHLEAVDTGPVHGARVGHHERALAPVDLDPLGRVDGHEPVVDRSRQTGRSVADVVDRSGAAGRAFS